MGRCNKMTEHKVALESLKKAGIKPEVGVQLSMTLNDGKKVAAKITKVEKDSVIVTTQ